MPENDETENENWTSIEQLLEEANAIHFVEPEFRGKKLRVAWKEIPESRELDIDMPKTFDEMTPKEKLAFQSKLLESEALARIQEAGRQDGCFNDNVLTRETWDKLPQRVRTLIVSEILEVNKILERRF